MENQNCTFHVNHKVVLVLLSLIGALIILLVTTPYGIGLSSDSVGYIGTARNIAAGIGPITENGLPLIVWPPLYPTILAGVQIIFGVDPLYSARYVNAILYGLIVYLTGLLFLKHLKPSTTLALFGTTLVLVAAPLIEHSLWALSESLFLVFVLLYLLLIDLYLSKENKFSIFWLSVAVALACLTRYIGVILIVTGAASIVFFRQDSAKNRLRHLCIFIGISTLPIGMWILRNYFLSGTFFGHRGSSTDALSQNLIFTLKAMLDWYVPRKLFSYHLTTFLVAIISAGLMIYRIKNRNQAGISGLLTKMRSITIFTASYVAFVLAASTIVAYDQINNRLLSPVYIPTTILILVFLFDTYQQLILSIEKIFFKKQIVKTVIHILVGCAATMYFLYQVIWSVILVKYMLDDGEGYNSVRWRKSDAIINLRETIKRLPECRVYNDHAGLYSNAPEAIYILTEIIVKKSPLKTMYRSTEIVDTPSTLRGSWPSEGKVCLIWFNDIKLEQLFSLEQLQSVATLQPIAIFEDGAIYQVTALSATNDNNF